MGLFGGGDGTKVKILEQRVERLERLVRDLTEQVAALRGGGTAHSGPEASPSGPRAVVLADPGFLAELKARRLIQAIKIARERTGLGLKDAKDLVDEIVIDQDAGRL